MHSINQKTNPMSPARKEKMKVLIFGSTGSIGRELVKQALEQGHVVTAFARNPDKVDLEHANLTVAQGDVMDPAAVEKAVQALRPRFCWAPRSVTGWCAAGRNWLSWLSCRSRRRSSWLRRSKRS